MALLLVLTRPVEAHPDGDAQLSVLSRRNDGDACDAHVETHRGELLQMRGSTDEAMAAFDRAAACDPTLAEPDIGRAALLLRSGRPAQAVALLDAHRDDARALLVRGRACAALGRFAEAVADFDAALSTIPDPQPEHYLERSQAQVGAGELGAAVAGLDRGLDRLGPVPALLQLAVDLEVERRNYDGALRQLDRTRSLPGQELWLFRRGEILEQAGRACRARSAYEAVLRSIASRPAHRRDTPALRSLDNQAHAATVRLGQCALDPKEGLP